MAFDVKAFRQALSGPVTFQENKVTDTVFNVEETLLINQLKGSLRLAMEDGGISTYSNPNMVIAGGFFASMFNSTIYNNYNDLDVFILNNNEGLFQNCIQTTTYKWKVNSNEGYGSGRNPYFHNPHILKTAKNDRNKVQFILTDYKTREELIASFDFVHCTINYVPITDKLYITRRAYDANKNKELLTNSKTEDPPQWRIQKFIDRGWKIDDLKSAIGPKPSYGYGSPLGVGVTAVPLLYNQTA